MASHIWLGGLKPRQEEVSDKVGWHMVLTTFRGMGMQAIIAKGNVIEGIEAKT